ncbi:MAG: RidA family protein [Pseudomonadota bacterium]
MKSLTPAAIHPPFADYSHGIVAEAVKLVVTSGQLGIRSDGCIPAGAREQAEVCFGNIDEILKSAELDRQCIIRLNAYVTDRAHMAGYMAARDAYLAGSACKPASTLMIVSGFTRPEFLVEVEALAAGEN